MPIINQTIRENRELMLPNIVVGRDTDHLPGKHQQKHNIIAICSENKFSPNSETSKQKNENPKTKL